MPYRIKSLSDRRVVAKKIQSRHEAESRALEYAKEQAGKDIGYVEWYDDSEEFGKSDRRIPPTGAEECVHPSGD